MFEFVTSMIFQLVGRVKPHISAVGDLQLFPWPPFRPGTTGHFGLSSCAAFVHGASSLSSFLFFLFSSCDSLLLSWFDRFHFLFSVLWSMKIHIPSIIDVWFVCLLVFCSLSDHLVFAYYRTQISVVLALIDRFCPNDFISKVSYLCTLLCTLKLCHTIYLLELRQASDDSFVSEC